MRPYFFGFDLFLEARGKKFGKIFVGCLGDLKRPKGHFKIT